jgi:hypothetical protein
MSIDFTIEEIRPGDERWNRMKRVYEACIEADVPPPKEVSDYFDDRPSEHGVRSHLLRFGSMLPEDLPEGVTLSRGNGYWEIYIEIGKLNCKTEHICISANW